MEEQLEKLRKAHDELEQLRIEHEEKLQKSSEKIKILESECDDNSRKIKRLSDLNQEMSSLIEQERQYNYEEMARMDRNCLNKIK